MAGIIKVDRVQSDSNLAFNIAGANVAFIDASSLQVVSSNVAVGGTNVIQSGKVLSTAMHTGAVLQVVQGIKTDTQSGTFGSSWLAVSGLTASITPVSSTSKILVMVDMKGATPTNSIFVTRLLRNGNVIDQGDAASNRRRAFSQVYHGNTGNIDQFHMSQITTNFLDSPATTSSITYSLEIGGDGTGVSYSINKTFGDRDTVWYDARLTSTITLMEIAV